MDENAALNALRNGKHLAAEVTGCETSLPTFVGVYPLDLSTKRSREFVFNHGIEIVPKLGTAYHIRRFSVNRELLENDVWIGESELQDKASTIAFSEAELFKVIDEYGVVLGALDIPANSEYPI